MKMRRIYATANRDTLKIKPIWKLVMKYNRPGDISIDPFARNCEIATYRNDINRKTRAEYHDDILFFLKRLEAMNVVANLAIFDPPYSAEAAKREYGRKLDMGDICRWRRWTAERNILDTLVAPGGVVITLGWDSTGMGKSRGYEKIELLLVNHGQAKNDTICLVERKIEKA